MPKITLLILGFVTPYRFFQDVGNSGSLKGQKKVVVWAYFKPLSLKTP